MTLRAFIVALHAALFAIPLAVSPAGSCSMTLCGAGKVGGAPAVATFVRVGPDQTQTASSTFTSTALSTASSPADRFIIVVATDQNGGTLSSITVNGVPLNPDKNPGSIASNPQIWSGLIGAAGGNSLSIVLNYVSAAFANRTIEVWMGTGLTNTAGAATVGGSLGSATASINVANGDFLIAATGTASTFTGSAPDTSPATSQSNATFTPPTSVTAEWNKITTSNASFTVTASVGVGAIAAATYH